MFRHRALEDPDNICKVGLQGRSDLHTSALFRATVQAANKAAFESLRQKGQNNDLKVDPISSV